MRKINNLKIKLIATLAYIVYLVLRWFSGAKCIFLFLTTLPCPFCGMTRACLSVLRLDIAQAFEYNMMFWSVPILYLYVLFDGRLFKNKKADIAVWTLLGIGFAINWIYQIIDMF